MMNRVLPDFKDKKVVVIGDLMLDQYIYGTVDRISPEAPVPVMLRGKTVLNAGGAANVALNISSLGATPILIGSIGNDSSGDSLIKVLENEGIETNHILRSDSELTTVKTRLISGSQHLMRIDEEIDVPIDEVITKGLMNLLTDIIEMMPVDAIMVEDYDKGLMTPELIEHIRFLAKERNIFTSVDPKFRHFKDYKDFDLLKPNLREVNQALKTNFEANLNDLLDASRLLIDEMHVKELLITLGEQGIFAGNKENFEFEPAEKLEIIDVCGAGDAVFAVSTLCLVSGMEMKDVVYWANRAGAEVCKNPGVIAVTKDQLMGKS